MAYDPYVADSAYVRFHLVRVIAEKLPQFTKTEEVIGLLEALSAYVAAGSSPPEDDDDDEPTTAVENLVVTHNPGGYI